MYFRWLLLLIVMMMMMDSGIPNGVTMKLAKAEETSSALSDRLSRRQLEGSSPLIELDADTFYTIVEGSRNFSTFIVMTALDPQHRCVLCREFHNEYLTVATAWQQMNIPNRIYFTFIDYTKGAEIFQKVILYER